ncbi:uncharacterized protein LOC116245203 [Nymphaea colorata]|uniref:Anaphase-promoting complex subunit 4-like WD40 domain-containing protein n=1 Tax=Nymphaea colorata TaxID=210225 RepID=A0A5K1HL67_9MAGN|nr:uncharacterized protein LOC116245203 [Nymphaea colorata]VVW85944.1 unnamed protein product [Nymphaea colorata]
MSTVKHLLATNCQQTETKTAKRNIHLSPEKVLDAPDILDDYYLNLLDWSSKGTLSIGLGTRVYLYTPASIRELTQKEDEYICSVSSNPQAEMLAVGLSKGTVEIYDIERETLVRTLRGHADRVSSSAFTFGMLFTGSKDTKIISHDVRAHQSTISKYIGHRG